MYRHEEDETGNGIDPGGGDGGELRDHHTAGRQQELGKPGIGLSEPILRDGYECRPGSRFQRERRPRRHVLRPVYVLQQGGNAGRVPHLAAELPGNAIYNGFAATLDKAYGENTSGAAAAGYGPNFENAWRELGHGVNKGEFANAQTEYWGTERYSTLISRLQSKYPSLNLNDYSIALKNVLWSRSVQHGVDGAYNVVTRAIDNRLGGFKMQSEAELIEAIYTECSKLDNKYKDMQTQLSDRYGVKNRSMAYYSAADGDV